MKADIAACVLALMLLACSAAFATRPSPVTQLLAIASVFVTIALFLAYALRAARKWNTLGFLGLFAPALLLAALPLGVETGRGLRTWLFQRDLPRYQAVADWAKTRAVAGESVRVTAPPEFGDLAHAISVEALPGCGTVVDFWWGSGFPVKHSIRRYAEDPGSFDRPQCREGWTLRQRRALHWAELGD